MKVYCPECETACSEQAPFCPKCGHPLLDPGSQAQSEAPPPKVVYVHAQKTKSNLGGRTTFLKVLLALGAAVAVVSLLSSFMQVELLSRSSFTEAEAEANDARESIIGLFDLALYLLTVVIFCMWIVRANKNVRALGANELRITPGWAVGYFFVPIMNLWRPYQAMKDLWRASHNPSS